MRAAISASRARSEPGCLQRQPPRWLDHRRRARYAVPVLPPPRPWPLIAGAVVLGSAVGYVAFTLLLRLTSAAFG